MTNIMENHHVQWAIPLLMAILTSYVKLPEGKWIGMDWDGGRGGKRLDFFGILPDDALSCDSNISLAQM